MRNLAKAASILLLLVLLGLVGFKAFQKIAVSPVQIFLDKLFKEDVSYQFQSYAAKISAKQNLHVAKLEQVEVIQRTTQTRALWLTLPKVVVRLEVPVEYNFYVPVSIPWKFDRTASGLVVHVPELANATPAANISKMKLEVTAGNFLLNEESAKRKLQQEVHTILIENSIDYREKVRDEAREAIRLFVSSWLLQLSGQESSDLPVRIVFPGEGFPRPRP